MTIAEAQAIVDKWINSTGVRYFNELTNTAMLMEEVGEVARIMARQYGEQSFKKSDEEVNLADEMADVLFVLICLANQTGIDLTDALSKNLDKKSIFLHQFTVLGASSTPLLIECEQTSFPCSLAVLHAVYGPSISVLLYFCKANTESPIANN